MTHGDLTAAPEVTSASDALHWPATESANYVAIAPAPGGAVVLVTTYEQGPPTAGAPYHLRAFRVRT